MMLSRKTTALQLGLLAALVLAAAAAGAGHRRHAIYASLQVGAAPVSTVTKLVPNAANATVNISFNGHSEQASWSSGRYEIEYGWHGVIVTLTGARKTAPVKVRAASTRSDVVRVFVRISW